MWQKRTEILIGKEGIRKLENSTVAIVGVGGVGGYACMMLARAGVGHFTLVDFDTIEPSNINRQIVATQANIGKFKTDVMKQMILEVNPSCDVEIVSERFCVENAEKIFKKRKYDYVIDAIDSTFDKVELISYCKNNGVDIISSMGAGNRIGVPVVEIMDIFKTSNDGLAKSIRKKLREKGIKKLDVAIAKENAVKIDKKTMSVGSISYYPAVFGCVLASFVVNKLIGN